MRALSGSQIRNLVPMQLAVELMKAVFAANSAGETISPLRTPVNMPDGSGVVLFMPAYVPHTEHGPSAVGTKVVSVFTGNRSLGLPTINAMVIVVDTQTGIPLGVLEGATITALRTGAVSGAASDLLARSDASTLAIIGAGAQGVTQAAAVCAVRGITEIRVCDLSSEAVASFADRIGVWDRDIVSRVRPMANAQEAVTGADIICTATTSTQPVFDDEWISPGVHINAVGAYTPQMQEIPDETIARSTIVVDTIEAAMHEAGDLIQAISRNSIQRESVSVELGDVVAGKATGRRAEGDVTFFKSVGNAIQDMVVAGAALQAAERSSIGQEISLD